MQPHQALGLFIFRFILLEQRHTPQAVGRHSSAVCALGARSEQDPVSKRRSCHLLEVPDMEHAPPQSPYQMPKRKCRSPKIASTDMALPLSAKKEKGSLTLQPCPPSYKSPLCPSWTVSEANTHEAADRATSAANDKARAGAARSQARQACQAATRWRQTIFMPFAQASVIDARSAAATPFAPPICARMNMVFSEEVSHLLTSVARGMWAPQCRETDSIVASYLLIPVPLHSAHVPGFESMCFLPLPCHSHTTGWHTGHFWAALFRLCQRSARLPRSALRACGAPRAPAQR